MRIPTNLVERSLLYQEISCWFMLELVSQQEATGASLIVNEETIAIKLLQCGSDKTDPIEAAQDRLAKMALVFEESGVTPQQLASWCFAGAHMAAKMSAMAPDQFAKSRERGRALMETAGLIMTVVTNNDRQGISSSGANSGNSRNEREEPKP